MECILYTGDCRVSRSELMKMDSLHLPISTPSTSTSKESSSTDCVPSEEGEKCVEGRRVLKPITHLYVDTTFCSTRAQDFPGRVDVLDELVGLVRKWMERSPHNYLNLSFSGKSTLTLHHLIMSQVITLVHNS